MLDDLVQTIETLQKRIKEHGPHIGIYESRTRVTLIDPMLCALGWDVADPTLVQIEPRTSDGWADYALLDGNGKIVFFVEAKKLADTASPVNQIVGYVVSENIQNNTNVRYAATTNGDVWRVYDVTAQKEVLKVEISGDDAAKCALDFLSLWRRSLRNGSLNFPNEPLYSDEASLIVHSPIPDSAEKSTPEVSGVVTLTPPPPPGWTPLTASFETTGHPAPESIQFPDGTSASTKHWRDILSQSALWLNAMGKLSPSQCPVPMSASKKSKRYLFNTEPRHVSGDDFKHPVKLGYSGMFMEANLSASAIVSLARREIEKFGFDPAAVNLKLS